MYLTTSLKVILLLALGFWVQIGESQVVISPEIGVSYMPFGTDLGGKKRVDFLFGLSGQIQLTPSSFISPSVSYVNRENVGFWTYGFAFDAFTTYKHSDINIDLIYQRKIYNNILIGIGGSLIYKLNTNISESSVTHEGIWFRTDYHDKADWWKGINLTLLYQLNPVEIKLKYSYFFKTGDNLLGFGFLKEDIEKNRFDLMVSYPLEFGKKNSR